MLLALALVFGAGAAAFFHGRELAGRLVHVALARAGVAPDSVEVRAIGLSSLVLGPIRLGGAEGPSASEIEIGWTLPGLLSGRLAWARIEGLALNAEAAIRAVPAGKASGGRWTLPVDQIRLEGARIALTAVATTVTAAVDATADSDESGRMSGRATVDAIVKPKDGTPIRVTADLPEWHLAGDGAMPQLRIARAALALPAWRIALSGLDARFTDGEAMSLHLSGELRDGSSPPAVRPLAVTLDARSEPDAIVISGQAATRDRALVATLNGRHALASGRGSLDIKTAPIRFDADGRQPADLFPVAGDALRKVEGAIVANGTLSWGKGVAATLGVTFEDVGFARSVARIGSLNGTIALDSVAPPRTRGAQRLTADVAVASLPPGPLELRFDLPGDGRLQIAEATFGLAGGTLALEDVTLARGRAVRASLAIRAVDLGAILALIGVDGLSGSGTLEGKIPFRIEGSDVAITAGRLVATEPGIVRYTGAGLPDPTGQIEGAAGDSLQLLRQALADFHYDSLVLTLDRAASGEGGLLINLKGANPAVLDGHPFAINVRLESNFDRLAIILFDGYAAAEELLRRATKP